VFCPFEAQPPVQAMIAFIDGHRALYGVEPICRVLPFAPSTYHAHAARRADAGRLPARAKRDATLVVETRRVHAAKFGVCGVYGAPSVPEGRLFVRWRMVRIAGAPHLLIELAENSGPPVTLPTPGGGSRLVQRGLAQELGGEIKLNFAAAGLFCVITVPLGGTAVPEAGGAAIPAAPGP